MAAYVIVLGRVHDMERFQQHLTVAQHRHASSNSPTQTTSVEVRP